MTREHGRCGPYEDRDLTEPDTYVESSRVTSRRAVITVAAALALVVCVLVANPHAWHRGIRLVTDRDFLVQTPGLTPAGRLPGTWLASYVGANVAEGAYTSAAMTVVIAVPLYRHVIVRVIRRRSGRSVSNPRRGPAGDAVDC